MRYETKKGLLKSKPLQISQVYGKRLENKNNFTYIILSFSTSMVVKDLLFKFINNLKFNLSVKNFKKQLSLLEPLTEDEQIRIINNTIEKGWKSLIFEYNKLVEEGLNFYESK